MPWVLSGCRESSNLTNERISISTHNGNSRTGKRSKRPKGKNCKADSAWNRRAPEGLPGVPQDRCWGPATGAELQSGEAYALWLQAAGCAEKVYAVYEAGPLGYVLYRKLRELGIEALVCAPECLEAGSKRKHNKIDASKLTGRLYTYLGGDRYALRIVRVPSPEQERLRARSRQHDQLVRSRKALGAQGRSLMLTQGYGINGSWWRAGTFDKLRVFLPEWISQELAVWQTSLLLLDQQIALLKTELAQSLQGPRPKGFGALSLTQLDREVFDYHRFANVRSVGCFGGLCPSEHSTGDRSKQRLGSITKVGHPRIRVLLVEMAWRLVRFQPQYVRS